MSVDNPYQSPAPSADPFQNATPVRAGSVYTYTPLGTLTRWARISLGLTALAVSVLVISDTTASYTVPGYVTGQFKLEGLGMILASLVGISSLAVAGLMISNVIAVTMWMYRANANIWAMGTMGVEYTPGWTAGYWFIPFVNLVRPYQAMKEIYQASAADSETAVQGVAWKNLSVPTYVGGWWAAWIIGNIFSQLESRMIESPVFGLTILTVISLVGMVLTVTSALLAAKILHVVSGFQDRRMGS